MNRTSGLMPLPSSRPALQAELERLERELGHAIAPKARRLLSIERRRVVVRIDQLDGSAIA